MVNRLYESLGVAQNASPEEIRKAYKKKALLTHPDRLPPGSTPADKSRAAEQFRMVNNAYEVLSDAQKRREYDRHGQWPPPEPGNEPHSRPNPDQFRHRDHRHRPYRKHDSFDDPIFHQPAFDGPGDHLNGSFFRSRRPSAHTFTDPFALFDAILGEHHRFFQDGYFAQSPLADPFQLHPLFNQGSRFDRTPTFPFPPEPMPPLPADGCRRSHSSSYQSTSRNFSPRGPSGNGRWVSESRMTRTVNGVTQSIWKRTDADGNDHVTYSSPDGRERYLINGVEQPSANRPPADRVIPPPPYGPPTRGRDPNQPPTRGRDPNQPPAGHYNSANIHHGRDHSNGDDHMKKRWWRGNW